MAIINLNFKYKQKSSFKKTGSSKVFENRKLGSRFVAKTAFKKKDKVPLRTKIHFVVGKFVNHLMISGKKEAAERLFSEALLNIYKKENKSGLLVFLKALDNTKPTIDLRSVRRGGASYQIPVPLKESRSLSFSIKWLIEAARKKNDNLSVNLSNCFLEASKNQGYVVKKREAFHLIALKNRSLTHFRRF